MQASTTWIVTRHPGALEFLARRGISGRHLEHLELADLHTSDRVIGTLPVQAIAQLNRLGIEYWHLCIDMSRADRGIELCADQLEQLGATLRLFHVTERG